MKFHHGDRVTIPACTRPQRVHLIAGWHPRSLAENPTYVLVPEDDQGPSPTMAMETALTLMAHLMAPKEVADNAE